jgi:hypothetical protein
VRVAPGQVVVVTTNARQDLLVRVFPSTTPDRYIRVENQTSFGLTVSVYRPMSPPGPDPFHQEPILRFDLGTHDTLIFALPTGLQSCIVVVGTTP